MMGMGHFSLSQASFKASKNTLAMYCISADTEDVSKLGPVMQEEDPFT
jgi:hypothetical protein